MSRRSRLRVIWLVMGLVISVIGYLIGFNYYHSLEVSKQRVVDKLQAITRTAAVQIDGERLKMLNELWQSGKSLNIDSAGYNIIQSQLNQFTLSNRLEPNSVHTLFYDSLTKKIKFGIGGPLVNTGEIYRASSELRSNYEIGGVSMISGEANDERLSSFSPIRDRSGKVVGVLIAHESCSAFIKNAHQDLLKQSSLALTTVLPLVLGLFLYTRKILDEQKRYETDLKKQQEAILHQSNIIKEKNKKLERKNHEIEIINSSLESKVNERTQSLLQKTHDLKTYLYRSSHDMRGPIASLLGLCNLMITEGKIEPYASLIHESSISLSQRIKSLGEVYEITSRKVEAHSINVCDIINDIRNDLVDNGFEKYVLCQDAESCSNIIMDAELAKILIRETVHNAIYHNRNEEKLTHIWLKTVQQNGFLQFEIRDDGVGMDTSIRERAFDMFFRGHELSQGIGLGLYKVKMIIQRLNGEIFLKSDKGKGTSVQMAIPLTSI